MKRRRIRSAVLPVLLVGGFLLLLPALIPRTFPILTREGVDSYRTHEPLFGSRIIRQQFTTPVDRLSAVELILVPYDHRPPPGVITLTLATEDGRILAESSLAASATRDDTFVRFPFPTVRGIRGHTLVMSLTAPAVPANARVGARVDPNARAVPGGNMSVQNTPRDADLAIRLMVSGNLYEEFWASLQAHPDLARDGSAAFIAAGLIAALWFWIERAGTIRLGHHVLPILALVLGVLAAFFLVWRLSLLPQVRAESGGDAYNFFRTTQRIRHGDGFYNAEEKRLPLYPLLLLPATFFTTDIAWFARTANQVIVIVILLALGTLACQLRLPRGAALFAVLVTAVNRDMLFTPFRPLAYPFVTALLLLGLVVLFWASTQPQKIALASVLFGLAAQTRHEGILAAFVVVLLVAGIWCWERRWRAACAIMIPYVCIVSPYFLANIRNYGTPFYSPYFDHPVTNIYRSLPELQDNVREAWAVVSSAWWFRWDRERLAPLNVTLWAPTFALGILATILPRWKHRSLARGFPLAAVAFSAMFWFAAAHAPGRWKTAVATGAIGAIIVGFLLLLQHAWRHRRRPLGVGSIAETTAAHVSITLLTGLTLLGIAVYVHPAGKQFVSVIPFFGLAAGTALAAILAAFLPTQRTIVALSMAWVAVTALLSLPALSLASMTRTLPNKIDRENRKHVADALLYATAQFLSSQTGKVGARFRYPPAEYFLGNRLVEFPERKDEPPERELRATGVRWVIWSSWDRLFQSYTDHPERYPVRFRVTGTTDDDEAAETRVIELPGG